LDRKTQRTALYSAIEREIWKQRDGSQRDGNQSERDRERERESPHGTLFFSLLSLSSFFSR
jgi:hypothetical protein